MLLVWGDKDWSTLEERERDHSRIPSAEVVTVANGGHFLPLDRPDALVRQIELVLHSAETTERGASRLSGNKPRPLPAIRNSNPRLLMNRSVRVVLLLVFGSVPCARAQEIETPRIELYGGYDYVRYNANPRINGVPPSESFSANRITGTTAYNPSSRFWQESISSLSKC